MSSSPPSEPIPIYKIRRYQPSDIQGVKDLFTNNIIEEWGSRYHDGKYIENAERYIESVVNDSDSDLNYMEASYFCKGGFFWVLTCCMKSGNINNENDDGGREEKDIIVGTCGLQRISNTEAELRRVCMANNHRSKGWGSKLVELAMERARSHEEMMGVQRVIVSTIEHSIDGINFYKTRHGFVDTIDENNGLPKMMKAHGTPISEVFMECKIR